MKHTNDYEFDKMRDDCTFKPQINYGVTQEEEQNVQNIKGMDKMMDRMNKARELQMQRKLMTERGIPA